MRLLDWEIDNPIIVSSGPFTNSKSQIDKMFSYRSEERRGGKEC